jgi:hypothetical protein
MLRNAELIWLALCRSVNWSAVKGFKGWESTNSGMAITSSGVEDG